MSVSDLKIIHVAVGVIRNDANQVLLALRPDDVHQGGLWEFPGGKVEAGETSQQALTRELFEETGIEIIRAEPLIKVQHQYEDRSVLLDVWSVLAFRNEPYGREDQNIDWVNIDKLSVDNMPAADLPIINAIRLPECCLITPNSGNDINSFMQCLQQSLVSGIKLVQFRSNCLSDVEYVALANDVISLTHDFDAQVMINQSRDVFEQTHADGLHLSGKALMLTDERPLGNDMLLSASCHNVAEVEQANKAGIDFIFLSPVLPTQSHPGATSLGWQSFHELTDLAEMPVYALGGMERSRIAEAQKLGAQGIAAIRALWGKSWTECKQTI